MSAVITLKTNVVRYLFKCGPRTVDQLADAIKAQPSRIGNVLRTMEEKGQARFCINGCWELTKAGTDFAKSLIEKAKKPRKKAAGRKKPRKKAALLKLETRKLDTAYMVRFLGALKERFEDEHIVADIDAISKHIMEGAKPCKCANC